MGEVYDVIGGGTPSTAISGYWTGETPWITSADIGGIKQLSIRRHISEDAVKHGATNKVPAGSVLVATRVGLGKVAITERPICFSQDIQALVQNPDFVHPFYALYLLSFALQRLRFEGRGTTISGLTKRQLTNLGFVLPPFNEQRRIVARLEELFSELDAAVESLNKALEQLKVYRQALLKHAFGGKLTATWREQQSDKLETAEALIARIGNKRTERYHLQIAEWERARQQWIASGGRGRKPSKPAKPLPIKPLVAAELTALPDLPKGWAWARVGQLFDVYVGATPSRESDTNWAGDIPWVSSGEVAFCRIRDTREKLTVMGYNNASTTLHPPGTVMLAMIGEGRTRGQAAILEIAAAHNQNTAAIRVSEAWCSPEYLYHFLALRYETTRQVGSGNNQKALNKQLVAHMVVPICSYDEQSEISAILESRLSVVERFEGEISAHLLRAETLRQSILRRAFSGKLVPQNPSDEPASVLLERIRAAKATAGDNKSIRGRRGRKSHVPTTALDSTHTEGSQMALGEGVLFE